MDEAKVECPPDLKFDEHVFSLAFSPTQDIVASGLLNGQIHVHNYNAKTTTLVGFFNHHSKACRCLTFSDDGSHILHYNPTLVDLNTRTLPWRQQKAHAHPISAMLRRENLLVTGDDEGTIKVWDLRENGTCKHTISANTDFISDMAYHDDLVLATSGDGTLSGYDIRKGKLKKQSPSFEDEYLSLLVLKRGRAIAIGTQTGNLEIYTYGEWEDASDRFVGHPESIDSMVAMNEETIITGSSDGLIRVVAVHPNNFLGVIGEHEDFPVERLALARDRKYLASCSHDNTVKFWNVSTFFEDLASYEDSDSDDLSINEPGINVDKLASTMVSKQTKEKSNFFADL